ncbi:hypothetical protein [Tabrizicola sp.]|uniref:hypothetical protein n=1 Tax=Tabrizicola sp. TaxID=2005166 RepID=UPI00261FD8FB|nr:hypothetical protein [Tabrizicola sp.]MDM7930720.1 hypothetical protein [Tabrizicola sp.]
MIRLAAEKARIEDAAVLLPVTSALDGWRLIDMTTEDGGDVTATADALFRRAREEALSPAPQSLLAAIFDQWLPPAQQSADGTATDAGIQHDLSLVDAAAKLPTVERLDVWRKVAMVMDVTARHTGAEAALMQEARAALAIKGPTHH